MGHTWVVVADEKGEQARWVQSYITYYTLQDWLTGAVNASQTMGGDFHGQAWSMKSLLEKFEQIVFLERATKWTVDVDAAYEALFGVSPGEKEDRRGRSGGSSIYLGREMTSERRLKFYFEFACQHDKGGDF